MVESGDEDVEYADRIAANADVTRNAWKETLEDAEALADELEAEGWDVFHVAADQTAPEIPDGGETDRWGLVHVIADNFADGFESAFAAGDYPVYDVFRQEVDGSVFFVTLLRDPDAMTTILIAGNYRLLDARGLVRVARREEHVLTHVQTLDGTVLGSFRHDDPSKFFPREEYEGRDGDGRDGDGE